MSGEADAAADVFTTAAGVLYKTSDVDSGRTDESAAGLTLRGGFASAERCVTRKIRKRAGSILVST